MDREIQIYHRGHQEEQSEKNKKQRDCSKSAEGNAYGQSCCFFAAGSKKAKD